MNAEVLINPVSGGIQKNQLPEKLRNVIPELREIHFTRSKHDTFTQAQQAAAKGCEFLVVAGGDGTLRDAALGLMGSKTRLVIYPQGSGNGLARALGMQANPQFLRALLFEGKAQNIDVGSVNGHFFLNVAGFGFDAHIARLFESSQSRGLKGYIAEILKAFRNYPEQEFTWIGPKGEIQRKAFVATWCNGGQYGNNAWIHPPASPFDGVLHATLLHKPQWYQVPGLALALFRKTILQHSLSDTLSGTEFQILRKTAGPVNLDGEALEMEQMLHFKMHPQALGLQMHKNFIAV